MDKLWNSLLFETCELGVSSAVPPELLPANQFAWGFNLDVRGGKPSTRPAWKNKTNLPEGLIQGGEYFSVQGGMIITQIAGNLFKIRVNGPTLTVQQINLPDPVGANSALIKQVYMCQTVETIVIQDGQSNAILYDGSTAKRAIFPQVPRGRQMAYGNGRLWVAINANQLVAGDIRTNTPGSELEFTEVNYLSGGGSLFFADPLTALAFIPVTGVSDYGTLVAFGAGTAHNIRADITSRDDWAQTPGFVTNFLRAAGCAGQWSIASVNQDMYWRDDNRGIRSIRNALADQTGPGNAPISREVSRLTDYDFQSLLPFCSSVLHDNRLLMTSSPFLLPNNGVGWKDLIALDFAPLATMGGKSQPAYCGQWQGLNIVKLVQGKFSGVDRAFALTTDLDGNNQVWEIGTAGRDDVTHVCNDVNVELDVPITCYIEYPLRDFGASTQRKRLERLDLWITQLDGELDLKVYWRMDNSVKWLKWDEAETCAKTSDPEGPTPHVWKNLSTQPRPDFKTFTIPDDIDEVIKYAAQVGFECQIRIVWSGRAKIHRMMVHGQLLDDPDYANRETFDPVCIQADFTGNEIHYRIPTGGCPVLAGINCGGEIDDYGVAEGVPIFKTYTITNSGQDLLEISSLTVTPGQGFSVSSPLSSTELSHGESAQFTLKFDQNDTDGEMGNFSAMVELVSNDPNSPCVFEVTARVAITFEQYDGPFVFPMFLFDDPGQPAPGPAGGTTLVFTNSPGDIAPGFYRDEQATGFNSSKTTFAPFCAPGDSDCVVGSPTECSTIVGVTSIDFGGEYTFDSDFSGAGTGALTASGTTDGAQPGPAFFNNFAFSVSAPSTNALFVTLGGLSIPVVAESSTDEFFPDQYINRLSNFDKATGWFVATGVGITWCSGTAVFSYAEKAYVKDLGYPVARTGVAAQTQNANGGNTYNGTTRTFTGNKSRMIINENIPAGKTKMYTDYSFLVTPDTGNPYVITGTKVDDVTPLTSFSTFVEFPWIIGAKVEFQSVHVSFFPTISDDFSSYPVNEFAALGPVASWQNSITFGNDPVNSICWDDFRDANTSADQQIVQLTTGYGWNGVAVFSSVDGLNALDDFEGYPVGSIGFLNQGIGWPGPGMFGTFAYPEAYDDFEGYPVGVITSLDGGSVPPVGFWAGDGVFGT